MGATAVGPEGTPPGATGRGFRGKLVFWLPWPLLVGLDLWSKAAVFAWLAAQQPNVAEPLRRHVLWDGVLACSLVNWRNPGTVWGLFGGFTGGLIVIRCLATVLLLYFAWRTSARARGQLFVLSLILAGAIGNLYDNFCELRGEVRDFLYCTGTWPVAWGFPAFNVADSCITVGAIGLFWLLLREDRKVAKAAPAVSSPP